LSPFSFQPKVRRLLQIEQSFKARLVNIAHLLSGNVLTSIVGVLGFLITARALGPADYGILALTYAYVRVVGLIVGMQTWQPLIKYAAEIADKKHLEEYRSLLKFGFTVDILAALAGFIAAAVLALLFGPYFGIGPEATTYVLIYSSVLLFQISGTPTAIMRLAGAFRLIAYGAAANATVRTVLCAIGLLLGADILYFVIVWTLTQIAGSVTLVLLSIRQLLSESVRNIWSARLGLVRSNFKGLIAFTIGANVEQTVRSSANEFDTLIVGALTEPATAGLYSIAKRSARLILQLGVHVQAVFYPDVARLWAANAIEEFRRAVLQMEVMLALFGMSCFLVTLFLAERAITWMAGAPFAGAAILVKVQMLAVAIALCGSAMRTGLLATGKQPDVLKVTTISTVVFHVTALALVPLLGAIGANIAHVALSIVWLLGLIIAFRSALRETGSLSAGHVQASDPG
jgi:O-antigen/teichoic acid export membrane protein